MTGFGSARRGLLAIVTLAASLAACAHVKVVDEWRDPEHRRQPRKVLVHAMAVSPTVKDLFENSLVARLKERGVDAVAGHNVLPDSMEFDKEAMRRVVREQGIDAILIGRPTDRKTIETVAPGRVSYGATVAFDPDGTFVMAAVGPTYTPGSTVGERVYAEFILFDVPARKRVWALHTKAFIGDTRTAEVEPGVELIMERLRADGMIP